MSVFSFSAPLWVGLAFGLLGLWPFWLVVRRLRAKRWLACLTPTLCFLLLLVTGAFFSLLHVSIQGFSALTREERIGTVQVLPLGPQLFEAVVVLKSGENYRYQLAGDEVMVDAHILKWEPLLNLMGLHTQYELDRISGRYRDIEQERTRLRTVHLLRDERTLNAFALRQKYDLLGLMVDAKYGSSVFVPADRPMSYELRVTTSGLIMRPLLEP